MVGKSSYVMAVQYNYKAGRIQLRLSKSHDILSHRAVIKPKHLQSAMVSANSAEKTPVFLHPELLRYVVKSISQHNLALKLKGRKYVESWI